MNEIKFKLYGEDYTIAVENKKELFDKVYGLLNNEDKIELASDEDGFLRDIVYSIRDLHKKLYMVYTHVNGYDTYDSGVFCHYTPELALESAYGKYTSGWCNSDYSNMTIEEIGSANDDIEIGEVLSSFNAG